MAEPSDPDAYARNALRLIGPDPRSKPGRSGAKKPRGRSNDFGVVSTDPIRRYKHEASVEWCRDRRGHSGCRTGLGASSDGPVLFCRPAGQSPSDLGGSAGSSSGVPGQARRAPWHRHVERQGRRSAEPRGAGPHVSTWCRCGTGCASGAGLCASISSISAAALPAALGLSAALSATPGLPAALFAAPGLSAALSAALGLSAALLSKAGRGRARAGGPCLYRGRRA